jgi:hypothetical protein
MIQNHGMRFLAAMVVIICAGPVHAGDYMLYVFGADAKECKDLPAFVGPCNQSSHHACSATRISEDLRRYFLGAEPEINALVASFGNGHLRFCSIEAKHVVSETLREIEKAGANKRGRQLADFVQANGL